ncbi:GPI biosynthesis protein family Pig-F-domain-containing protein [Lyophyllum atratum]|nr:GPI biosynthesis protein family Pig-F-domain-containing protein [Lyophyllum atratum]
MGKGKAKGKKAASTPDIPSDIDYPKSTGFFPFARYTSVVGVHTTLLTFTALFLPRTTFLFEFTKPSIDPELQTSRDRPQHPFLEDLTVSPVSTLLCICAGVFLLQGWWGGWMRDWWIEYALEGSDDEKKLDKVLAERQKIAELRRAWIATFAASLVFHGVLVLFGAPLTSHIAHTYLLALLISLLVVFPPVYSLGPPRLSSDSQSVVNRMTWVRLFAEFSIRTPVERAFVYPAIGTALGCWAGVIPIALDWDRPWQAWPLTPAYGAILGYTCASLVALTANCTRYLADEHIRSLNAAKKNT